MSNSTSFNIGEHYKGFLARLMTSGRYHNASEAMREALRLLEQEEAKFRFIENALDEAEASGECTEPFGSIVDNAIMGYKAENNG